MSVAVIIARVMSEWRQHLATVLVGAVMCILLVAGGLKAADVVPFMDAIETWELIPKPVSAFIALTLPSIEIGIAFAWILNLNRRYAALAAACLLIVFTAVYLAHVAFAQAPDCGCLGRIKLFHDSKWEAAFVIGRNSILLAALVAANRLLAWKQRNA